MVQDRRTPSLFGRDLKNSLGLEQVKLKSEDLDNYSDFFVDNGLLDRLRTNENQLIIGRRGTGKTHLLGAFHESVHDKKEYWNCVSIFISIMEVRRQTPPVVDDDSSATHKARIAAKDLFSSFLRLFFDRFLNVVDFKLKEIERTNHASISKPILDNTFNHLLHLLSEIENGSAYESERKKVERITRNQKGKTAAGAGAALEVSGLKAKASGSLNIGKEGESATHKEAITEINSVYQIDLQKVRELTLTILGELGIDTMFLLIDEWMELEKRTPSQIQPHFAQLLKATFFNTGIVSVKIASVWHQTSLYSKDDLARSEGIQTAHDISFDINLDTAFLTREEDVSRFCKELLFRRVSHVCPKIKRMQTKDGIDDTFVSELFDNSSNFKVFISASHGIPRDLMNIFQKSTLKISRDFEKKCIDIPLVSEVSSNIYKAEKRKRIDPSSMAQKLLTFLNEYMSKNDRRMFFVKNEQAGYRTLQKLVDEEMIHQIPSSSVHRDITDKYKVFTIDFGNYADLLDSRNQPLEKLLDEFIVPDFSNSVLDDYRSFIVDVAPFEVVLEKCEACGYGYPTNHPVVKKQRACPKCGENI